jgi:hypothetical protein
MTSTTPKDCRISRDPQCWLSACETSGRPASGYICEWEIGTTASRVTGHQDNDCVVLSLQLTMKAGREATGAATSMLPLYRVALPHRVATKPFVRMETKFPACMSFQPAESLAQVVPTCQNHPVEGSGIGGFFFSRKKEGMMTSPRRLPPCEYASG